MTTFEGERNSSQIFWVRLGPSVLSSVALAVSLFTKRVPL